MVDVESLETLPPVEPELVELTSDTDPETKLKALELGATDFLEKPLLLPRPDPGMGALVQSEFPRFAIHRMKRHGDKRLHSKTF